MMGGDRQVGLSTTVIVMVISISTYVGSGTVSTEQSTTLPQPTTQSQGPASEQLAMTKANGCLPS
jgi:hypothetical protein